MNSAELEIGRPEDTMLGLLPGKFSGVLEGDVYCVRELYSSFPAPLSSFRFVCFF